LVPLSALLEQNLLDAAQRMGAPPWQRFRASVEPIPPDSEGVEPVVLLRENADRSDHGVRQLVGPVVGGQVYRISCRAKAHGRGRLCLRLRDDGAPGGGAEAWFNLTKGKTATARVFGTGSARLLARMEAEGDGWYRCTLRCQVSKAATTGMYVAEFQLAARDRQTVYQGDGTSGVQLAAPRVVHERGANLLYTPKAIGLPPWRLERALIVRGGAADGSGILLREDADEGEYEVRQIVPEVLGGQVYSLSLICKAQGRDWLRMVLWDYGPADCGGEAWFDLSRGRVGTARLFGRDSRDLATAIQPLGDGWYRCGLACIVNVSSAAQSFVVQLQLAPGDGLRLYKGDAASGIIVREARLEARRTVGGGNTGARH